MLQVYDYIESGNYVIQSCGAHATGVKSLLGQAHSYIQDIIDAIDAGATLNLKAYIQWFYGVNPDTLGPLLKNVVRGGVVPLRIGTARPSIICLSSPFPGLTYYYDVCKSNPTARVIYIHHTGGVGLCDLFFSMPLLPTSDMCGRVVPGELPATTMLVGDNITITQVNGLIHGTIHAYLGSSWALSPEVFDRNRCASLPPKQSVRNPENYNYYIASMCIFSDMNCGVAC